LRDFKGLSLKSFDKNGNYTIGLKEHTVFPEIDLGKSTGVRSLEISIVTNAGNIEKSKKLLELLGMPFEKEA
jgi:large subunit ribosomal protein L5